MPFVLTSESKFQIVNGEL